MLQLDTRPSYSRPECIIGPRVRVSVSGDAGAPCWLVTEARGGEGGGGGDGGVVIPHRGLQSPSLCWVKGAFLRWRGMLCDAVHPSVGCHPRGGTGDAPRDAHPPSRTLPSAARALGGGYLVPSSRRPPGGLGMPAITLGARASRAMRAERPR